MGMVYMARAGYDPQEAINLWKIMLEVNKGKERPPQWLSTHPITKESQSLKSFCEALEIYNASDKRNANRNLRYKIFTDIK